MQLNLRDAGFDVIGFEGPGQGAFLEDEHLPMVVDWHTPLGAVLDHFGVEAEDHYVPLHQFYDQIRWLTGARSITARLFTRSEQAQNHVHIGNVGLSLRVIVDWIVERQRN